MPTPYFGKELPSSLWSSKTLHIPEPLRDAHKDFLIEKGWLDNYDPKNTGIIGGASEESAQAHVVNRFLNSAARMQYVCSDPNDEQTEVRDMILDQMSDGTLHILDLAAGNGAGTLAALSLISQLRAEKQIPTLPLNINITGFDFSADALNYYVSLLEKVRSWLESKGLHVNLSCTLCDLGVPGEFSQELEAFFDEAKKTNATRFLCVISALSGIKKEGMGSIHTSLTIAAASLSHNNRNSSLLWVEPKIEKSWFFKITESVRLTLQKIKHTFLPKGETYEINTHAVLLPDPTTREFQWHDPYLGYIAKSRTVVMAFRNHYV